MKQKNKLLRHSPTATLSPSTGQAFHPHARGLVLNPFSQLCDRRLDCLIHVCWLLAECLPDVDVAEFPQYLAVFRMADDHSSSATLTALADSLPSLDQVRYSLARLLCGLDRHTGSSVADILLSQSDARLTALLAALAQIRHFRKGLTPQ